MSINKTEIKHIAELARLHLTSEEETKFGGQLESVLKYVEKLNEVDTKNIKETAQVSGLVDVSRSDIALDWDGEEVKAALDLAESEGGQIKVRRVL